MVTLGISKDASRQVPVTRSHECQQYQPVAVYSWTLQFQAKQRAMTRLQKVGFAILFDATLLFTELGARAVEHKTRFSFTFCHVTYIFLADHTVFEENHEGRLAVFTVVQHTHHAICVHAGPCIKLQRDKDNESGTRLENKTVPMSSLALHRFLLGY